MKVTVYRVSIFEQLWYTLDKDAAMAEYTESDSNYKFIDGFVLNVTPESLVELLNYGLDTFTKIIEKQFDPLES